MLEVKKLSRKYGDFLAVDEVSFSIEYGEIAGLLGRNGAGKTTIMKMLSGYLEPNKGQIKIDATDFSRARKSILKKIGYLPENLPVYPEMCVADYLDYAAVLKGLDDDFKQAEIRRVIEATDIKEKILSPIATLSRGYKQRVGVAQAILGNPSLLYLDEPTNGLDPTQTEHMRQLIRDIAHNATVIISTHIMQEVDALCDRVLIVEGGKLVIDARLDELKLSRELELSTDLDKKALQQLPSHDKAIKSLEITAEEQAPDDTIVYSCRLNIVPSADMNQVSTALARKIIDGGANLYRLQPVTRNLESLFREVSEYSHREGKKEGLNHAA